MTGLDRSAKKRLRTSLVQPMAEAMMNALSRAVALIVFLRQSIFMHVVTFIRSRNKLLLIISDFAWRMVKLKMPFC